MLDRAPWDVFREGQKCGAQGAAEMKHEATTESCPCHLSLVKANSFPEEHTISNIRKKKEILASGSTTYQKCIERPCLNTSVKCFFFPSGAPSKTV